MNEQKEKNSSSTRERPHWSAVIFRDVHFWIPLFVLLAGIAILNLVR